MKARAAFLLLVFTLSLGPVWGSVIIDPIYVWTGSSAESDSVSDTANWSFTSPSTLTGDGTEALVFGDLEDLIEESVLVPLSAAFKHLQFTGSNRPRYVFEGEGEPSLILVGDVTANLGGHGRPITLASSLSLGLTEGPHVIETEATIQVYSHIFDHDGIGSLVKAGAAGLYFSEKAGESSFSGGTLVDEGSVFVSGETSLSGNTIVSGPVGTGALQMAGGTSLNAYAGGSVLDNAVSLPKGNVTIGTESATDSLTLRGTVSGAGQLVIDGAGAFALSGSNTYSGGTVITSGTVVVGSGINPLGTGNVIVESGATLRLADASLANTLTFNPGSRLLGDGSVASATIGNGVTLSPGALGAVSVGTLSFNDLTLLGGGNLEWTLRDASGVAGTGWDLVNVTSPTTLTIGAQPSGRFNLKLFSSDGQVTGQSLPAGFDPNQAASWLVFSTNGIEITGGGSLADSFAIDATGFGGVSSDLFSLTRENNNLFLTFTPVPEPSTYGLLTLGLAALGLRAWRRKR